MKKLSFNYLFIFTALYICTGISVKARTKKPHPVVVELFTSEGCSSCPPADRIMAELQKEYEASQLPVYFIAYHVDYWNYLGWKDNFSSPAFTLRQKEYASALSLRSIYTPQSIVNGHREMVGSQKQSLKQAINDELAKENNYRFEINTLYDSQHNSIAITYNFSGNYTHMEIHFVITEKEHTTRVLKGENEGKTLKHINIVKQWENIQPKQDGTYTLKLKTAIPMQEMRLIAFIQTMQNKKIIAATKGRL